MDDRYVAAVVRYARRFHDGIGVGHLIASPLGAWLVLALVGSAADGDRAVALKEAIGLDLDEAAMAAGALLADPHPLVFAAAALWHRPGVATPELGRWIGGSPRTVQTGPLPDQAGLDAWATEHTDGLIDRFPIKIDAAVLLVLASALATRVSWEVPFETAPAAELGSGGGWAVQLTRVLRSPPDPRHVQFIADTDRCGLVAVHAASARGGLMVASVIAAPDVAPGDVLGAAHEIAVALADRRKLGERTLFDLPLGDGPAWTITEEAAVTTARDAREQRFSTYLPTWSARSEHDLRASDLGFAAAAATLDDLLGPSGPFAAKQVAVARYSRTGFEAAAVTGLARLTSAHVARDGIRRNAFLRYGHPYAAVAVTTDPEPSPKHGTWHGLPVFSAWIADPDDTPPDNEA